VGILLLRRHLTHSIRQGIDGVGNTLANAFVKEVVPHIKDFKDKALDKLDSHELARTHHVQVAPSSGYPEDLRECVNMIQTTVLKMEEENWPLLKRTGAVQEIKNKYPEEIGILEGVRRETVQLSLDLGELYLKSGLYDNAYNVYKKCLPFTDKDGWVYLRLAESCLNMDKATAQEGQGYIRGLIEALGNRSSQSLEGDEYLYAYGALIAWKYGLLNEAINLGKEAIGKVPGNKHRMLIYCKAHLLYYYLALWESSYAYDENKWDGHRKELEGLVQDILDAEEKEEGLLRAVDFDSLAWFYYWRARVTMIRDPVKAEEDRKRAEELIRACYHRWADKERNIITQPRDTWSEHSRAIEELGEKLASVLSQKKTPSS